MSKKATKPAKKKLSQIELADEIIQKIADNKLDTENLLYQVLLRSPETENFYEMFQFFLADSRKKFPDLNIYFHIYIYGLGKAGSL